MNRTLKVPMSALLLSMAIWACGGEAESADAVDGELISAEMELEERGVDEETGEVAAAPTPAPPPASAPRSVAPAPSAPPPPPAAQPQPEAQPQPQPQEEAPAPDPEQPVRAIPTGSLVTAALTSTISTRTHEAGATFTARVTDDLRGDDGLVLVPAGAILEGRVLEARASEGSEDEALLVLGVESLDMEGWVYPLRATIVQAEMVTGTQDSGTRTAAKVATGAAAGAVVGQILGRDTRSTVRGAAAGAVAGAGVAITTRDGHARMDEGARLTIQFDEAVPLVASGR